MLLHLGIGEKSGLLQPGNSAKNNSQEISLSEPADVCGWRIL